MLSTLEVLSNLYSEHIWIIISDTDLQQAKSNSQNYSNQTGKNYAYINSLVRTCFIKWMKENLDINNQQIIVNLPEVWEFVNGSAITFQNKRLILIPSDALDTEELTIPKEWVDIPSWAGDYYLAVQIDLEKKYIHIWGYVSRQTLKQRAIYDPIFRNYDINADNLIDDLDLLWRACQVCQEKGEVESLAELSASETEKLITKLSAVSTYSPRLDVDFEQWGALLNNTSLLTKLYQQRVNPVIKPINLIKWLENQFDQAIESGWLLVNNYLAPLPVLSQFQKIERAKLINLPFELHQKAVILILAITPEINGRYEILVQVRPSGNQYLPDKLSLALCLVSGEKLQSVISRQHDISIQLHRFLCDSNDEFSIQLTLEQVSVIENFSLTCEQ